jgi:hypothetical protein
MIFGGNGLGWTGEKNDINIQHFEIKYDLCFTGCDSILQD